MVGKRLSTRVLSKQKINLLYLFTHSLASA